MFSRVSALAVCVVIAVLSLLATDSKAPESAQAVAVTKRPTQVLRCDLNGVRQYVAGKRRAAWGWQDQLEQRRHPTQYREKATRSCRYLKWISRLWQARSLKAYRAWVALRDPRTAICHVFGDYCRQAVAVAWCESRHSVWAKNGQYLGLFQMGYSERLRFGHGNTAIEQARAAKRYFDLSGRDWSPWSCKPWYST